MGMNVGGGKGSVQSEINVTPLIDVLLVLLIIFLVIMPVMIKAEALEVPRELASDQVSDLVPLTIIVKNDLAVSLDDNAGHVVPIAASDLPRVLGQKLANASQKVVFVDFEDGVPWSEVISAMDTVRGVATDASHDGITVALKVDKAH